jgi:hypothetical protein
VPSHRSARPKIPKPLVRLGQIVVVLVVAWLVLRLLRTIDWSQVGYALTHLSPGQIALLLCVLLLRRAVLASPLALLVRGLGYLRAMLNDVAATAVAMIAPSPGDVVLRLAMMRSWGVDATDAASGLTLSTLLFYIARLAAPVLGFVVFWAARTFYAGFAWSALLFGAGATVLLVGLLYALRAERTAAAIGRLLGRLLKRVRPSSQGPDVWAQRLIEFQSHSAGTMRSRGLPAGLLLIAGTAVEAGVLILCLSFVGVQMDGPTVLLLACSFLVTYPLTGLPLMGAGVMDTTYAAFVAAHSDVDATHLVAGLLVWRVTVQLTPVVVGLLTVLWWRRSSA